MQLPELSQVAVPLPPFSGPSLGGASAGRRPPGVLPAHAPGRPCPPCVRPSAGPASSVVAPPPPSPSSPLRPGRPVALGAQPVDEPRPRLHLRGRHPPDAQALERPARQARLGERRRARVPDGEPQARARVRAYPAHDPGVEAEAVDGRPLRDDLSRLDVVLLAGALLVGAHGVGEARRAPAAPLHARDVCI